MKLLQNHFDKIENHGLETSYLRQFRLSKALDKYIIITPTFDTLFILTFQDLMILKREFCVL